MRDGQMTNRLLRASRRRGLLRLAAVGALSLSVATVGVAVLQDGLGVPNPSALYLVAVVSTAILSGTYGAIFASVASFLLYNFLFVAPRFTLSVARPGELVNLLLLLFVGIVVGQLTALQRARAEDAIAREREARALFRVSRVLAVRESIPAVLGTIVDILRDESGMDRIWVSLGQDDTRERVAADTAPADAQPAVGLHQVLHRTPGDAPARWLRIHAPGPHRARAASPSETFRVRIEAGGESYGSIWATRSRDRGEPDLNATRLLAAAADQIGQALRQERLAAEAHAAEIARQSDALKSALLQSVSHDLRTPLATIRAAAGTLRPGVGLSEADQQDSADAIDREVEYLNRLVTNLLDLSRIEAGALRAELDVFELDDLVGQTVDRLRSRLAGRPTEVRVDAAPVNVDPVFLDEALTNALENTIKYTPPGTAIRISAVELPGEGMIRLSIEDAGSGVPDAVLPRLFDKFYRVPGSSGGSRAGTGIGLAVVRGLVEAMGGRVGARRSDLGGLAIDLDLPAVVVPTETAAQAAR
jgi:two-component system sensor histidine kinase KdpD